MMLGGKYHVFHPCILSSGNPFFRIKLSWVKSSLQILVCFYIAVISCSVWASPLRPSFVFGAYAPAFYYSPLAIGTPMHKEAKFKILPLAKLFSYKRIVRNHITF